MSAIPNITKSSNIAAILPCDVTNRKRAVGFVSVRLSNPNGDPDDGGRPRILPDGHGLITDTCIKRVIRDYAAMLSVPLYVARGIDLGEQQDALGSVKGMLDRWDYRLFGGVATRFNGRVRGCVQVSFAESVDPVDTVEIGGTRVATHKGEDSTGNMFSGNGVVSYGLYRVEINIDPPQCAANGVTDADIALLWEGLIEGWQFSRARARTGVDLRALYVFDVPGVRGGGEMPRNTFARVKAGLRDGVEVPTKFEDYEIDVDTDGMPKTMGVYGWEDGATWKR